MQIRSTLMRMRVIFQDMKNQTEVLKSALGGRRHQVAWRALTYRMPCDCYAVPGTDVCHVMIVMHCTRLMCGVRYPAASHLVLITHTLVPGARVADVASVL